MSPGSGLGGDPDVVLLGFALVLAAAALSWAAHGWRQRLAGLVGLAGAVAGLLARLR